jgi:hypothetical protein
MPVKKIGLWLTGTCCILAAILIAMWLLTGQREIIFWVEGTGAEFSISEGCLWCLLLGLGALGILCGHLGFQESPTKHLPLIEGFQTLPPGCPEYLSITQQILHSQGYAGAQLQPLEGGYESSGVFVVKGHNYERQQFCDRVLKLGNYRDISTERTNYSNFVSGFLPKNSGRPIASLSFESMTEDHTPAGVLYDFARLEKGSDVENFQTLYLSPTVSDAEVTDILHSSLALLMKSWYESGTGERINQYREYPRLLRKLDTITVAVEMLTGASAGNQREIELRGMRLKNPVDFVAGAFQERYEDMARQVFIHRSIIHGDLHSRNILVERAQEPLLWFIDFSNTQSGSTLRDFCSLEADIKFCLLKKTEPASAWDAQTWDAILEGERRFSPWKDSAACFVPGAQDLDFLSDYPDVHRAWECVTVIRELAQPFKVSPGWSAYGLALLHATLPMVYYRQCTLQQKEYALISAAWLCDTLE